MSVKLREKGIEWNRWRKRRSILQEERQDIALEREDFSEI